MTLSKHYYNLYVKLNKKKSYALAEKSLRKAIELEENAAYYFALAKLLKKEARWWQVADNFKKALSLNSENNLTWRLAYIESLEKMNNFSEVINIFKTFDNKEMTSAEYFRYGCALDEVGKKKESEKLFSKAIKMDDKYQSEILGIGIFYEKKGRWLEALRFYKKKAEVEPFNALLHYKLGLSYDRNYEWEQAQKSISYAISLDNKKAYFFNRLAFSYERNGQFSEASDIYALAIHKEKNEKPDWNYRLGYSLAQSDYFKAACQAFLNINSASNENDKFIKIEEKIRTIHKVEFRSKLTSLLSNINDLSYKEELKEIIELAKATQVWDIVEACYKVLLSKDNEIDRSNYFFLAEALYKQKKYEEACENFLKQKIVKNAHGVSEKKFETDKGLKKVVSYAELLKEEKILEKTILYQVLSDSVEVSEPYKVFVSLMKDERFKSWTHVWVIPDDRTLLGELKTYKNVIFVTKETNLYLKYLASSEYIISNEVLPFYFIRQHEQKYLYQWMGVEDESIREQSNKTHNFLQATHVINEKEEFEKLAFNHYNIDNLCTAKVFPKSVIVNEEKIIDFLLFDKIDEKYSVKKEKVKKSILFFAPLERNGIGSSILNLLNVIDLDLHNVTIVLGFDDKIEKIEKIDKRINIIRRFGRMILTLEEQWLRDKIAMYGNLENKEMMTLYKNTFSREFRRIFGVHKFDTIIDFNGYRTFWTSLFAFGNSTHRVIYLHSDMYKEHQLRFPSLAVTFNLYKYFDKLVSVSESAFEANKATLSTKYKLLKEAFAFSNNPIDFDGYRDLASEPLNRIEYTEFMNDKRKKFINVGRLSPEKGQLKLIEAFSKLLEKDESIALYIVGEGPLYSSLLYKIKEYKMQKNVILLGYQSNPYPFIANADCMMLTSQHEGQSLVLLEALVLGIPCISTDIPGPKSILEGGHGILCPDDAEGIVQAMEMFLANTFEFKKFDAGIYNTKAIDMAYKNLILN